MMEPLKIGVVGLGFGRCHVKTLRGMADVKVTAVAEKEPSRQGFNLQEYAQRIGATAYEDGLDLMESEALDGVILAISPKYRRELVEAAAKRNLPMLIEKPFGKNIQQGQELVDLCTRHKAWVMVDFCLRYLPAITRLQELLQSSLGPVFVLNGDLMIPNEGNDSWVWDPQNGNGIINENTCHMFDLLCFLMGEPLSLHAEGGAYLGSPMEDGVALSLRFQNGSVAVMTGGGLGAEAMVTPTFLSAYTLHGQVRLTGHAHMFSSLEWSTRQGEAPESLSWELPPREEIIRYALHHFLDCIRHQRRPTAGVAEGMRALKLAMAVRESLQAGRPVPLMVE